MNRDADQNGGESAASMQGEGFLNKGNEIGSRPLRRLGAKSSSAKEAYDRYAPMYDEANAENDYEMWLGEMLLPELEKLGLQKGWALDVGCGTGRAFEPLLDRGWRIVGCDASPRMLAEARRKFGCRVRLLTMDAKSLSRISPSAESPSEGAFQLILLLNDVVNYMTDDGDLERVFRGTKSNLSEDNGLVIFDLNTLKLFHQDFTFGVQNIDAEGFEWHGLTRDGVSGDIYEARVCGRNVETHIHRQRHWPSPQVAQALTASGLECVAILGQREEDGRVVLSQTSSEERDQKIVYIAAHNN